MQHGAHINHKVLKYQIFKNRGPMWLLYVALFIILIARLRKLNVVRNYDWLAFPHTVIP